MPKMQAQSGSPSCYHHYSITGRPPHTPANSNPGNLRILNLWPITAPNITSTSVCRHKVFNEAMHKAAEPSYQPMDPTAATASC